MIRVLGTLFAALLGLSFGSFLNVCLSRWPEGESIITPRSHCRKCGHTLAWWENVPLLSWLALQGRCRGCGTWIGWRYVIVEAALCGLWAATAWEFITQAINPDEPTFDIAIDFTRMIQRMALYWLLTALAVLDYEHLWLPDRITLPGILLGFGFTVVIAFENNRVPLYPPREGPFRAAALSIIGIVAAAALILFIRWIYWLVRHREGLGLGDAKLMALLAAWLGLPGALLSFGLGVVAGALVALVPLMIPQRGSDERWAQLKLPLGTFLCIGGIISGLWGPQIISGYLRWAGF